MSCIELRNELQQAHAQNKTGKMIVFGKLDDATKGVNIDIRQGKIMRINLGEKSGLPAANDLANIVVERIKFMKSDNIVSSPEENTPNIATLLGMIAQEHDNGGGERLIEITIQALAKIIGPNSKEIVEDIAKKFPPNDDEQLYIENCKQAITDIIGRNQADKLFASLRKN